MITFFFTLLFLSASSSLKIWIPNTDINNELNWDKKDTPKDCDSIRFKAQAEVAAYWNLKKLVITGLSLPETGDIIFPHDIDIQFRNREKCPKSRDLKYVRDEIKGWLDPDNWKSDSGNQWLPHSERVPCAGDPILFPPQRTFAVQLPNILVPIGDITFDNEVFRGDTWSEFLKTELGFQLFRGPDNLRNIPWRNDGGCSNKKKCICGRSPYSIRDGVYKETGPRIFEEAVCLYAMPKCQPSACYSPVVPEGHCCGICGAVIKIQDNTKEGLSISNLKTQVAAELEEYDDGKKLKTYVGRTKDENVQIVVVAENSEDTIKSHGFANLIKRKFAGEKFEGRVSSRVSGLRFSNYLFNSVSGAVFGTLGAVLFLFVSVFYVYGVLPKKKWVVINTCFFFCINLMYLLYAKQKWQTKGPAAGKPFMFARFENIVNEESLEIGLEAEAEQELPQAFDNPMYSGTTEPEKEFKKTSATDSQLRRNETSQTPETSQEYSNPVYSELEQTKESQLLENLRGDSQEFSEIKL